MKTSCDGQNIKPFNDIFFKDCFYNALFSALEHLEFSILPVLVNSIPVFVSRDNQINVVYADQVDLVSLLKQSPVTIETMVDCDDLIAEMEKTINEDRLLIIQIDCFYQPHKKEVFLKSHWPHSLLVYGYEQADKKMLAVEQEYHESLSYTHMAIPYLVVKNAYGGYLTHFQKGREVITLYKLSKPDISDNVSNYDLKQKYTANWVNMNDMVMAGLTFLKDFSMYVGKKGTQAQADFEFQKNILSSLNIIIHAKSVQLYIMERLKYPEDCINAITQCLKGWNKLRNIIAKNLYLRLESNDLYINCSSHLESIYDKECLLYQNIIKESGEPK